MDRRTFLKTGALSTFGLASAISLSGWQTSAAPADASPLTDFLHEFTHGRHRVRVRMDARGMPHLELDGEIVDHAMLVRTTNGFASHLLPFEDFTDLRQLAQRLVDGNGVLFQL